jgi:hypothetical protein
MDSGRSSLKQGFFFGLGLIAATVVVVVAWTFINAFLTGYRVGQQRATSTESLFTPTVQGLRGVVVSKGFECIDTASNRITKISDGHWRLDCPTVSYLVVLSADGEVLDVRQTRSSLRYDPESPATPVTTPPTKR